MSIGGGGGAPVFDAEPKSAKTIIPYVLNFAEKCPSFLTKSVPFQVVLGKYK